MTCRNEEGMVTAFAAVFAVALLLFAGLVLDGGTIVVDKRGAIDHAESAARAGAQALDEDEFRKSGTMTLDPQRASEAAQLYLQRVGEQGQVTVGGDQVQVTVERDVPMRILGIGGFVSAHVKGSGIAHMEQE